MFARVGKAYSVLSLVSDPDLPIKNNLGTVLALISVMILKRVRESFLFQSDKFTACKVKDGKEVAQS